MRTHTHTQTITMTVFTGAMTQQRIRCRVAEGVTIIIMYSYHTLITALSAHVIGINLQTVITYRPINLLTTRQYNLLAYIQCSIHT